MAKPGRKGWIEELRLYERYSDLTEDYFNVLKEHFASEDKKDRQWAAERIEKGIVKMIPQSIDGGEDNEGNVLPLMVKIIGKDE